MKIKHVLLMLPWVVWVIAEDIWGSGLTIDVPETITLVIRDGFILGFGALLP
jgi:hypothetical protein